MRLRTNKGIRLMIWTLLAGGMLVGKGQPDIVNSHYLSQAFGAVRTAGYRKQSALIGTWVAQPSEEVQEIGIPTAELPRWTLTLNGDGTFTQHIEANIMMILVATSNGRYSRTGNILRLVGTTKGYLDDGYKKGPYKGPFRMKLKYVNNSLIMIDNQETELTFRRKGDPAPRKPKPAPRASDPRALEVIREMQRRFVAFRTYADEGTLTSSGAGFMAKNAYFRTRFARPHRFLFEVGQIENGKEWNKNAVWSDGKKTWLYMQAIGGPGGSEERPLGNALSTISPICGIETMLVPALLLPEDFWGPESMLSKELTLVGEERVSGNDCYVIGVGQTKGVTLKLWIDKSSYLIRRVYDRLPQANIFYKPEHDIELPDSEFEFSPPKEPPISP